MKDRKLPAVWLPVAFFLLTGCQQESVTDGDASTKATPQEERVENIFVAGTANILLDEETVLWIEQGMPATRAAASFNDAMGEIGVTGMERIFRMPVNSSRVPGKWGFIAGTGSITVLPSGKTRQQTYFATCRVS